MRSVFLAVFMATACATPTNREESMSDSCANACFACQNEVIAFEHSVAQNSDCQTDDDCVAGKVLSVPGGCCFAANKAWWNGDEMRAHVASALEACGRRRLACDRYQCSATCKQYPSGIRQCRAISEVF